MSDKAKYKTTRWLCHKLVWLIGSWGVVIEVILLQKRKSPNVREKNLKVFWSIGEPNQNDET